MFMVRREQGRHGEMLAGLAAFAAQSAVAVWHAPLALLYAENGETENALAELDGLTRDGVQAIRRDLTWLFCVASLAAACAACDSRRHAAALYDALLPYDGGTVAEGVFCYFGPVAYYLGMLATTLASHDAAARHLDAALAAARGLGARPFVARILLAQAQALEAGDRADPSRAEGLRRQAAEFAESLGMHGVAAAARCNGAPTGQFEGAPTARQSGDTTPAADRVQPERRRATLRREGDVWVIGYEGRTSSMKAIKGFRYLVRLLASPGREFHVLEMAQGTARPAAPAAEGLGPILDGRARGEIRRRLAELREELAEAETDDDEVRASRARAEVESIGDMVAGAVGLGGRDREQGSDAERARAAVTKAVRAAIARIERFDAALADVLTRTIRTGVFCSYEPLDPVPIDWDVDLPDEPGGVLGRS